MNETDIIEYLNNWFKRKEINNHKFWKYNPLARCLKSNLKTLKRWKALPRGNPQKAFFTVNNWREFRNGQNSK